MIKRLFRNSSKWRVFTSGVDELLFLILVLGVHDVGATDWVTDEGEEAEGQTEQDGRKGRVATPHLNYVGRQLVVRPVKTGIKEES